MPMRIAAAELYRIEEEDLREAIAGFREGTLPRTFKESTRFDLLVDGHRRLPPKAIIALAARRTPGRALSSGEFSGGESSTAFRLLLERGFEFQIRICQRWVEGGLPRRGAHERVSHYQPAQLLGSDRTQVCHGRISARLERGMRVCSGARSGSRCFLSMRGLDSIAEESSKLPLASCFSSLLMNLTSVLGRSSRHWKAMTLPSPQLLWHWRILLRDIALQQSLRRSQREAV